MAIQAVIFDLGGVIFALGEDAYRREVARHLGLGDALPAAYAAEVPRLQRGEVPEQTVWQAVSGMRIEDPRVFDQAWIANFPVVRPMLDLTAELRARGLKTAVLSNTQPSHVAAMRTLGVLDPFAPVLMSCEVGCRKPEAAIFELALKRLGLPADQVAFVDDVIDFVEAARAVGIHAIHHQGDVGATRQALLALL